MVQHALRDRRSEPGRIRRRTRNINVNLLVSHPPPGRGKPTATISNALRSLRSPFLWRFVVDACGEAARCAGEQLVGEGQEPPDPLVSKAVGDEPAALLGPHSPKQRRWLEALGCVSPVAATTPQRGAGSCERPRGSRRERSARPRKRFTCKWTMRVGTSASQVHAAPSEKCSGRWRSSAQGPTSGPRFSSESPP